MAPSHSGRYGPVHKAFAGLTPELQWQLDQDLRQLVAEFNCSGDETMVVPGEYLEAVVLKQ